MSDFFLLLKTTLIEQYRINKLFKKDTLLKSLLVIVLSLFIGASLVYSLYNMYYLVYLTELEFDFVIGDLLKLVFSFSFLAIFITTIMQSNAYLFKGKDFEMLVSLPISFKKIVGVKIATILINLYLISLVIFTPLVILLVKFNLVSGSFYLMLTLIYLVYPLLILGITTLITFLIAVIFRNFKYKNLSMIVMGLVFLSLYFVLIFASGNDLGNFNGMIDIAQYLYYPLVIATNALVNNDILSLIIYLSLNVFGFIVFISVISKIYLKANTGLLKASSKNNKDAKVVTKGITKTLFNLELKKYLSLPTYVLNTAAVLIIMPVFIVVVSQSFKGVDNETIELLSSLIVPIIAIIGLFSLSLTSTTSSTISLEGENLWLLKSSPITVNKIFISKLLIDIVLKFVTIVISLIISLFLFKELGLVMFLILIFFLMIITVHSSTIGLLLNLRLPKLKWDLPVRVIKQSLSVVLQMLISFLSIIVIVGIIYLLLKVTTNITLIFLIITFIYSLIVVVELLVLFKVGPKWFNKLNV